MFDEQGTDKRVLVKRRVLLRITPGSSLGVIWRQKQSDTSEGLQFFFICLWKNKLNLKITRKSSLYNLA